MSKPSMEPWASLPHPCYVYCACFVPNPLKDQSPVVATGAYDGCVRMWEIAEGTAQVRLVISTLAKLFYFNL